jgi:hypothetical protein
MAGSNPVTVVTTVWTRLQRALALTSKAAQESNVKVGLIASGKGGEEHGDDGITMLELAAIHEFGAPEANIPQRSFIRSTFARGSVQRDLKEIIAKLTTKFIHGMSMKTVLGILGAWGVDQIRHTINDRLTSGPALAPATIKAKGSDLPLVDTGRLRNSMSWKIWLGANRNEKGQFTGGHFDL